MGGQGTVVGRCFCTPAGLSGPQISTVCLRTRPTEPQLTCFVIMSCVLLGRLGRF